MPNSLNPLLQTHFDTALEHQNGIKKLRDLILTLAMQGKLVPQDPNDQPASELLKEIQAEKARLVQEGKIGDRQSGFLKLSIKSSIPEHWVKISIKDLCDLKTGATPSTSVKAYYGGEIKWLVSGDINKLEIYDCEGRISESGLKNSNCKLLPVDSVMIALNGQGKTRATVALLKTEAACNQSLVAMIPVKRNSDLSRFLFLYFRSIYSELRNLTGDDKRSGLNMKLIADIEVPLPPLAEQKRIVDKIDELFLLCDELETLKKSKESKRKDLHQSVMTQMLESGSPESFQKHFQFLTTHFHELYSVRENVKELRKAVLQLAVMGKLEPQDPNDQPASELLKEIQAEKARLVAEGKVKKGEALPPVKEEEKPFAIPNGWEWVRLGEVMTSGLKNGYSPKETKSSVNTMKVLTLSSTTKAIFDPSFFKYADYQNLDNEFFVKDGDFLIQRGNSIDYVGIVALVENCNEDLLYPDLIMKFRLFEKLNLRLFHKFMVSLYARNYFQSQASGTSGTMPKINQPVVYKFPLPLPPLAEQKRIVEKVDELLVLCDELEEKIGKAEEKRGEILDGMVRV